MIVKTTIGHIHILKYTPNFVWQSSDLNENSSNFRAMLEHPFKLIRFSSSIFILITNVHLYIIFNYLEKKTSKLSFLPNFDKIVEKFVN